MRLLYTASDGKLKTETFIGDKVPQYAILSHTWKEGQEVTFTDLKELESAEGTVAQRKEGYQKIRFCARQAKQDGLDYFWVDTCCIDKANNTELSKAINSMFRWYRNAKKCYVFLSDVGNDTLEEDGEMAFRQSRWFSRGWTLQELLAPRSVEFFSKHGVRLGDKESLKRIVHEVTRIPIEALSGGDLSKFDVTQRFSWAASRQTTEEEDGAYCLFGIFGVHLPLIYGEGKERALKRLKKEIEDAYDGIEGTFTNSTDSDSQNRDEQLSKICSWLSAPDPSENYYRAHKQRQAETGRWLLKCAQFKNWRKSAASRLWLHGIPGCGKTVLSATVVEHLLQHCDNDSSMVTAYFYFYFKDAKKQDPELMLCSLLYQLLQRSASIPKCVDALFSSCENGNRRPSLHSLLEVLRQVAQEFKKVYIVLDALDECTQRVELMLVLETLVGWRLVNLHLLMTSRKERDIEVSLNNYMKDEEGICLQENVVDQDIQRYVRQRLDNDKSLSKWNKDPAISHEIEAVLMRGACGMFRWAACQLDMLAKCRNLTMLRKSLASLPQTLDQTYDRILSTISEEDCVYAMRILRWLTFSSRPLTAQEVAEVVAIDVAREVVFDRNEVLIDPFEALDICSSLVTVTTNEVNPTINEVNGTTKPPEHIITLAHYSVHEYLVSDRIRHGSAKQYSMQETECHKTIAEGCLKYLIQLEHPISRKTFEASTLARYTAKFWSRHLRNAGDGTKQLNQLAMSLINEEEPAFSSWIRLYDPEYPRNMMDFQRRPDGLHPPLYYAAILGLDEIAKLLLDNGAEVNEWVSYGCTALHAASVEGHDKVVKVLLDYGADYNVQSKADGNPLHLASREGYERVVKILLDKGADINAQSDSYSITVLQSASYRGHEQVVELLLSRGAEVNAPGGIYGTALHAALLEDYTQIIETLLDYGAGMSTQTNYGPELEIASVKGYLRVVKILLDNGTDANTRSTFYGNALHAAAYNGSNEVLKLLLSKYDTKQLQDPYDRSLLWWAAAGGHASTVQILLDDYKIDPQTPDKFGRTPFDIAEKKGSIEVLELIEVLDLLSREGRTTGPVQLVLPSRYRTSWYRLCNVCTSVIGETGTYYSCFDCDPMEDWDICEDCKTRGALCSDEAHIWRQWKTHEFLATTR